MRAIRISAGDASLSIGQPPPRAKLASRYTGWRKAGGCLDVQKLDMIEIESHSVGPNRDAVVVVGLSERVVGDDDHVIVLEPDP